MRHSSYLSAVDLFADLFRATVRQNINRSYFSLDLVQPSAQVVVRRHKMLRNRKCILEGPQSISAEAMNEVGLIPNCCQFVPDIVSVITSCLS